MQLGRRGEASPALFENRKKCQDVRKKDPDSIHHWVKFSIQNIYLGVSRRKNSHDFSMWDLFLVFLTKYLSNAQVLQTSNLSPHPNALKNPGCAHALRHYSFCKMLCLLTMCDSVLNTSQSW